MYELQIKDMKKEWTIARNGELRVEVDFSEAAAFKVRKWPSCNSADTACTASIGDRRGLWHGNVSQSRIRSEGHEAGHLYL